MSEPPARWQIFLLLLAGLAAYHNSFLGPFVFDDVPALRDNPTLRTLWPLTTPLSPPADTGVGGRPLANLSFALSHALGGGDVRGHHAVNLLLHLGSGLLLFGVARRTWRTATDWPAWSAALLWLVHPLTTASVTYLSQRTELLMGFLYLLTLYGFVRGAAENRRGWFALSIAASALGMLSKEVMVTAPLVVLLYDRTFAAGSWRALWTQRRGYYLALGATWFVLAWTLRSDPSLRSVGFGLGVSTWTYVLQSAQSVLWYVKLAVWPAPLVFDYGPIYSGPTPAALASLAVVTALTGWSLRATYRGSVAGFLAAAFLLLLAPTTSVVPVAQQPMAENRMYLSLIAVLIVVVLLLHRWLGRPARVAIVAAGLAAGLGALTVARNADYRSEVALWSDTVAKRPQNARARFNLGQHLLRLDRAAEAEWEFRAALARQPREARMHVSLGTALLELNRPGEAVDSFREAARLEPRHTAAWYNLGLALRRAGDATNAIPALERALALQPDHAEALVELGNAGFELERLADAVSAYERALALDANSAVARYNAGSACLELGRIADAVRHLAEAVRLQPNDAEIRNHHGAALLRAGRAAEAIAAFEAALRLMPDYADARENLEMARRMPR
jgi:tetratricopeptide (TPR) repeat protein